MTKYEEAEIQQRIGNLVYWALLSEPEREKILNLKVVVKEDGNANIKAD